MFVHPALTWGFFLALVPLAIHLINLVRRRRVPWAAMDFLLHSYKKHQKWIWLQQMLLLASRIIAILVAVAMLAQFLTRSQWFSLLGGRVTHHYVILDDSLSMQERQGGVSAFDRALQTLGRIGQQVMGRESPQRLTLIRSSRAAGVARDEAAGSVGQIADLNAEPVDPRFDVLLEERRRLLAPSQLAVSPRPALELVRELVRLTPDEGHVLHLLSDFRNRDWESPQEVGDLIRELDQSADQLQFVQCAASATGSNVAVVDIRPAEGVRAAGVPLQVQVQVTNFGRDAVRQLPVKIRSWFFDPQQTATGEPGKVLGKSEEPPAILIEELAPGQTTTRKAQVFFPRPGEHVVEASLPDDVSPGDNRRWSVVVVPEAEQVLAIDGDPNQRNAYYLTAAFQPGPRVPTGIRVDVKTAAALRDLTPEELSAYRAVYLLDVDRLEERAIENLETFVRSGGGLGVFVGEHVQQAFYTSRLYREGNGLFPVPLERDDLLPPGTDPDVPDLDVTDHPLFRVFLGESNPFIRLVAVERYLRPPLTWTAPANSTTSVLASLRNQRPLVVERRWGDGRVVAFLTTLAPQWNNWGNDPSFVVVLLELQAYLAAPLRPVDARLVGDGIEVSLPRDQFRADATLVVPGAREELPIVLRRNAAEDAAQARRVIRLPGRSRDTANAERAGIYEVWSATVAGPLEVRRFARNVDPAESDLGLVSSRSLLTQLAPARIRWRQADELAFDLAEDGGWHGGIWFVGLLVLLLLGEQVLGYFASYHPAVVPGGAR